MKPLAVLCLGIFFVTGCSVNQIKRSERNFQPKMVWDLIWQNQAQRKTQVGSIRAKIQLSLVEKKRSLSGTGVLISTADGVHLEVRDPLGRLQYSVATSKNNPFVAYYPSQNVAYFDSLEGRSYLRAFLKIDMKFSDLKDLWLGVLPFSKNETQLESVTPLSDDNFYEVKFKQNEQLWVAKVDPETGDILKLQRSSNQLIADFEFSEFSRCCEAELTQNELPKIGRNVFLKNNKSSEIELDWSDIQSVNNLGQNVFALEIPEGVKKIKIPNPKQSKLLHQGSKNF